MRTIKLIILLSILLGSKAHGQTVRELFLKTESNSIYSKNTSTISVLPFTKWIIGNNVDDSMIKYRIQLGFGIGVGYFPINRLHIQAQYIYAYTFDNKFEPIYTNAFGVSGKYVVLDKKFSPVIKAALTHYNFKFYPTEDYRFYTDDNLQTWNKRNLTALSFGVGAVARIKRFTIGLNYLYNSTLTGTYSPLFQRFGYEGTVDYHFKIGNRKAKG